VKAEQRGNRWEVEVEVGVIEVVVEAHSGYYVAVDEDIN
jgi:hypothetical protein